MVDLKLWATNVVDSLRPIAVVDIGSNSIRLVIYEGSVRSPIPVFNEKILCGLGRNLNKTGKLDDKGVKRALQALPRFAEIAKSMKVGRTTVLATAAVREASNGEEFVSKVKEVSGLDIKVISGHEEARLSGLGVLSGITDADGFMGDLGGGSVELVQLSDGKTGEQETLPLGPLRLSDKLESSKHKLISMIDPMLAEIKWLSELEGKTFYVVGGAWRTIAKIYMEDTKYPLHVLHRYEIDSETAKKVCDHIYAMDEDDLADLRAVSARRLETLPYAALLLQRIIKIAKPGKLVFSANGVREGALFDMLDEEGRKEDPLLAACERMPWAVNFDRVNGYQVFDWINPVFETSDKKWEMRVRKAACLLSEVGRLEHPDYRVDHALARVMRFPIVGCTHKERVFLALAVANRYGTSFGAKRSKITVNHILSPEEIRRANATGCAMRLAYALTGGVSKQLNEFELAIARGNLILSGPLEKAFMAGEIVEKRMNNLARRLDLVPIIRMDE